MHIDVQGLQVTTDSTTAGAAIDRFIAQCFMYGREAKSEILQAVAADPTCAIAQAYAAAYFLSQENAADRRRAIPYLNAANRHRHGATEREQLYIQAITSWFAGAINQATAIHEAIVQRFPHDLMSVQQGQYHYFYQGDTVKLRRLAEQALPANPDHPHLLGMLAFGLEQCHALAEAEAIGRQATELDRCNPWAHHAVAHVMEMQARSSEGIAWMEAFADTWECCNSMLYTHNWWHVALFYLQQREFQTVLSIYDRHIWGRARKHTPKDQVGAIALLVRLELRGGNVGHRWHDLKEHVADRISDHALPFQDLHYVYALARADQPEQSCTMLTSMMAHAQTLEVGQQRRWIEIAIPAAQGLIAHALGDWQQAIVQLERTLTQLWQLGGSHAQRHLFEQIYRDARRQQTGAISPVTVPSCLHLQQ